MAGNITTVRDILLAPLQPVADITERAVMSKKGWTSVYAQVSSPGIHRATLQDIEQVLGPDPTIELGLDHNGQVCQVGLQSVVHPLNVDSPAVRHENDVLRDFARNVSFPLRLAFGPSSAVHLNERSSFHPQGTAKTADYVLSRLPAPQSHESAIVIGQMKSPGVIIPREWTHPESGQRDITQRLGKEMRAFASEYDCPQTFVFDSCNLLILQFRAESRDHIADPGCPVDCLVIPRIAIQTLHGPTCPIQYALYRLAWRGWMRQCGQFSLLSGLQLAVHGNQRTFQYWSGLPVWTDGQADGYLRTFNEDYSCWEWVDFTGQHLAWDTCKVFG